MLKINCSIIVGYFMGGMLVICFVFLYFKFIENLVLINFIGFENYLFYEIYMDIENVY